VLAELMQRSKKTNLNGRERDLKSWMSVHSRVSAVTRDARPRLRRGSSGAKACARTADPKSRALETDGSRLNRRLHSVSGSSDGLLLATIDVQHLTSPGSLRSAPSLTCRRSKSEPKNWTHTRVRSQDSPRHGVSVPGDGKWKMPHARQCQYRTAHLRRAGAVRRAPWKHGLYSA